MTAALASIPIGVVVARHKAQSQWLDFVWRPVSVLAGVPEAKPWSELSDHAALYVEMNLE